MKGFLYGTIIAALLCMDLSSAQAQRKSNEGSPGGMNLMIGKQTFNPDPYFKSGWLNLSGRARPVQDSINKTIIGYDSSVFAKPATNLTMIGLQSNGFINRFLMGGELNIGAGAATVAEQIRLDSLKKPVSKYGKTSTRAFSANIIYNFGYLALKKQGFVLIPSLSTGWGVSGMWLQAENPQRIYPSIAGTLGESNQNLKNIIVWNNNLVLDAGLGMNYYFGESGPDEARGFNLGLKFGYSMQLAGNNFYVNEFENAKDNPDWIGKNVQLPRVGNSGFYIKALIGFGRIILD